MKVSIKGNEVDLYRGVVATNKYGISGIIVELLRTGDSDNKPTIVCNELKFGADSGYAKTIRFASDDIVKTHSLYTEGISVQEELSGILGNSVTQPKLIPLWDINKGHLLSPGEVLSYDQVYKRK